MSDVDCPYCGKGQNIRHDDGVGYDENALHTQNCSNCDKDFGFTTNISYSYEVKKTPCLNDGKHEWHPSMTWPKSCTKMRCEYCWEERAPTAKEKVKYNIPEKFTL